jgi:hypothetical protein
LCHVAPPIASCSCVQVTLEVTPERYT